MTQKLEKKGAGGDKEKAQPDLEANAEMLEGQHDGSAFHNWFPRFQVFVDVEIHQTRLDKLRNFSVDHFEHWRIFARHEAVVICHDCFFEGKKVQVFTDKLIHFK